MVTREFGMRYIWIDSLCIIQDSGEDWERGNVPPHRKTNFDAVLTVNIEAAKMCSVYKNALFTIAASRATTGDEGLFSPQDSRLHTPCYLPRYAFLTGKGNRYNIHLAPARDDNFPSITQYAPKGPLYDRAWVLQEELLSHATLAFTNEGMT